MLSIIVAGTKTALDDGAFGLLIGYDGWGASSVRRINQRSPLQHGETDLGFHLEPRVGSLAFRITADTLSEMYNQRAQLLDLFKPQNNPTLEWDLPNGDVRRIDVHLHQDLTLPWNPDSWARQKVGVQLKAPDPTFYEPGELTTQFRTAEIALLAFPVPFPIGFGSSIVNNGATINYQGTWRTYPTITLTGPMDNPNIEHVDLGLKLEFQTTLAAGEQIIIDLEPGAKTVKDGDGNNLIGTLTEDSDLATWRFETAPTVPGGDNEILVTAGGATNQSLIEFRWLRRFIGL